MIKSESKAKNASIKIKITARNKIKHLKEMVKKTKNLKYQDYLLKRIEFWESKKI